MDVLLRRAAAVAAASFAVMALIAAIPPKVVPPKCYLIVRINNFDKKCVTNASCAGVATCTIRTDTTTCPGFSVFFCDCDNTSTIGPDTTGDACQTAVMQDAQGVQVLACYDHSCGDADSRGMECNPSASDNDCTRDVTTQPDIYMKRCSCT